MKLELTIKKEFDVKYLLAEIGARYWEDATVNGIDDTDGTLIPCRDGEYWKPLIDIEQGLIVNWDIGKTASIHYKSCDDNYFTLLDEDRQTIVEIEGYVIDMMCIGENGYGDYVIMQIDENGKIKDWPSELDFNEFLNG